MQTNHTLKVEASKDFEVPVDKLYEAWTQPDQLKQWWKPMNNSLTEVTNDIKQGGTVKYVFEDKLTIEGEYLEVKEREHLAYTWKWRLPEDAVKNADYKLTVDFKSNGNGSTLHVTQDNFESEEGTLPHQEGWNKGLEDLANFLSGSNSGQPMNQSTNPETDRSGGYNESPEQAKVGGG